MASVQVAVSGTPSRKMASRPQEVTFFYTKCLLALLKSSNFVMAFEQRTGREVKLFRAKGLAGGANGVHRKWISSECLLYVLGEGDQFQDDRTLRSPALDWGGFYGATLAVGQCDTGSWTIQRKQNSSVWWVSNRKWSWCWKIYFRKWRPRKWNSSLW